jgi:bacterioferritin (cytochrome b1)
LQKASEEVKQITDVKAMLEFARQSEEDAIVMYNNFAIECGNHADSVSKKLFEELVLEENGNFKSNRASKRNRQSEAKKRKKVVEGFF